MRFDEFLFAFDANQGLNFIAVEGEQNAVDHCGNDGNFLPYRQIYTIHCALLL